MSDEVEQQKVIEVIKWSAEVLGSSAHGSVCSYCSLKEIP